MSEHALFTDTTYPSEYRTLLHPEISVEHGDLLGRVYGQHFVQSAERLGLTVEQLLAAQPKIWRLPRGGDPGSDVLRSYGLVEEQSIPKPVQKVIRQQAVEREFSVLDHPLIHEPGMFIPAEFNYIWESFIESGSTIIGLIGQILAQSSAEWHTFVVAAPTAMSSGLKRMARAHAELQRSGKGELHYQTMIQIEGDYHDPDHGGVHEALRQQKLITLGKSLRDRQ